MRNKISNLLDSFSVLKPGSEKHMESLIDKILVKRKTEDEIKEYMRNIHDNDTSFSVFEFADWLYGNKPKQNEETTTTNH
jgi:hypothetical protein